MQPSSTGFNHKMNPQATTPTIEPSTFTKTIGGTIYRVSVHFSQTNREQLEDKILRILEREVMCIA